jgi:membrane dipeptidase
MIRSASSELRSEALELHRRSIVIDGLNISRWGDADVYSHLLEGGVTAVNATVAVWEGTKQTLQNIARLYRDFERYHQWIRPVTCVADIYEAKRQNQVGIILGFQNSSPIEEDLNLVEVFYRLGVRVIQITYNDLNYVGAGCYERHDVGLSQFGIDLVMEMNRLGMVVDLSHVGFRTGMEAIEVSTQPVWYSHANPMALREHCRNKTDDQVRALVAQGGVVGGNIFPPFMKKGDNSTLEDFIDVLDYWVQLAGIDHVSIGLDFTENQPEEWFRWLMSGKRRQSMVFPVDLPLKLPMGIARADEMPNITEALLARGYSNEATQKILGLNVLQLFEKVWKE